MLNFTADRKFFATPAFGVYMVTLLAKKDNVSNATNLLTIKGLEDVAIYNKKSAVNGKESTQNIGRFVIAEGTNKGQIISAQLSDVDLDGEFGLFAHAVKSFNKPVLDLPEILKEMQKTAFPLTFHQEYSEDADRLFAKWGVRKTPNSVADDATLESIHAEQLAKKQREDAERAMLNSTEPVDNGEL